MTKQMQKDDPWYKDTFKWIKDRMFDYTSSQDCVVVWLLNNTGATSIRGTIVRASTTTDKAVIVSGTDEEEAMGTILKSGIADGSLVPVGVGGVVPVLLQNATAATRGYWARTSITTAGRADITSAAPPGGGVANLDKHMKELGHCIESVTAGTDKVALIIMHFN